MRRLEELQPDLCVTAAYGNMLPKRFLAIPMHGTLNIHPSLLPKYRGAAPVNRCLERGDAETGVSLAFTVLACDAGPVLAQRTLQLDGNEQAPELLTSLFELGSQLLLDRLPEVWSGQAERDAQPQDAEQATHAAKMSKEDALLDFSLPAHVLHNKVRGIIVRACKERLSWLFQGMRMQRWSACWAKVPKPRPGHMQVRGFAGWPGTTAAVRAASGNTHSDLVIKILRTECCAQAQGLSEAQPHAHPVPDSCRGLIEVGVDADALQFPCVDGSVLKVLELQAPGKNPCDARAFRNGMSGKRVFIAEQAAA